MVNWNSYYAGVQRKKRAARVRKVRNNMSRSFAADRPRNADRWFRLYEAARHIQRRVRGMLGRARARRTRIRRVAQKAFYHKFQFKNKYL